MTKDTDRMHIGKCARAAIGVFVYVVAVGGCARQEVFPVVTRSGLVFVTESGEVRQTDAEWCGSIAMNIDDYLLVLGSGRDAADPNHIMYICDRTLKRIVDVGFSRTFRNKKYIGGRREDGLWAVYTYEGRQVGPSWKGLNGISECGMVAASKDGNSWGVANLEGEWVITPKYTITRLIGGQLFGIGVGGEEFPHVHIPRVNATWGLARDDGTILREPFATGIGFVAQREQPLIPYSLDSVLGTGLLGAGGKWGFLDRSGSVVVKPRFVGGAGEFENDRCCVAIEKDGKEIYGFIDGNGVMAIEPQFNRPHVFSEGRAAVLVEGQWGYIDRAGEYAIAPQYEDAISFSEGRGAVKKDGLWGFIDRDGREVIPCQYVDLVKRFWRGVATVRTENETLLIDRSGNVIWSSGPEE
jgi:hypothetical protein